MPFPAQLLLILVALVAFFVIVMRPARQQQRRVARLQSEVAVGDRVVITAGIFGTVLSVDGATVELEVAAGVVLTVARQVVVRRAEDVSEPDPEDDEPGPDDAETAGGTGRPQD